MNHMKVWSGGQRERCHLVLCVTHLFVYECPPTLFNSISLCKDFLHAITYQRHLKHIGPAE